jgi:hypothetical protein
MASITFKAYENRGAGLDWHDISTNRLVFCGSQTDITAMILATQFNDGTHVGSGTPGSDVCTTAHAQQNKFISQAGGGAGASEVSHNGAATEDLNITNITELETSMRVHFNDGSARKIQNGRFYCFDGTTTTTMATGLDVAAWEREVAGNQWIHLNDYSTTGPSGWQVGSIGGDNAGEFMNMTAKTSAAVDQYWHYALSASPETAGSKSAFAFGCYLEYYS